MLRMPQLLHHIRVSTLHLCRDAALFLAAALDLWHYFVVSHAAFRSLFYS